MSNIESILREYLDRSPTDPSRGYITDEDLKETLRRLYREAVDSTLTQVRGSSAFGAFVRDIRTHTDWEDVNQEAATGTLPAGLMAILSPQVVDQQQTAQLIKVWTGHGWLDLKDAGAIPAAVTQLIISPTAPAPVDPLTFWLNTTPNAPHPLKVWGLTPAGYAWLEVATKGAPGETLVPEGFVRTADVLPDPPLWQNGPHLGTPKDLAVYTTITDKHMWVFNPGNPNASLGPAAPPVLDVNGNVVTPAVAPVGWIDMGSVEGPMGPEGPPFTMLPSVVDDAALAGLVGAPGQGVLVTSTGHLWTWNGTQAAWVDAGEIRGPQGPTVNGVQMASAANNLLQQPPDLALGLDDATQHLWLYDPNNALAQVPGPTAGQPATGTTPATPPAGWVDLGFIGGKGASITVTTTGTAGTTPVGFPFPKLPALGDIFINSADTITWVRGPDPAGTPSWHALASPGASVPVWAAANSYQAGDLVLLSPAHVGDPYRQFRAERAIATGGGSPEVTPADWREIGAVGSSTFIGRAAPVGAGTPKQNSLWVVTQAVVGATAGAPGAWLPAGAPAPATLAELQAVGPTAIPATAWTTGQHVLLTGGGQVHWNGTGWVTGSA